MLTAAGLGVENVSKGYRQHLASPTGSLEVHYFELLTVFGLPPNALQSFPSNKKTDKG